LTLRQWMEETGIPQRRIEQRLRRGWSVARALTQPLRRCGPKPQECSLIGGS
jgi:hypothetical protein